MRSFNIDDTDALRQAYVEEGLSLTAIARIVGRSYATVRRALLANGIEIRRSGRAPITRLRDAAWLRAQVAEGSSAREIAATLGCSEATVRSALQWAGSTTDAGAQKPPELDDRAFLERAYVEEGRSARSIAADLGCTKDAVLLAVRAHGLPVRTRGRRSDAPPQPPQEGATLATEELSASSAMEEDHTDPRRSAPTVAAAQMRPHAEPPTLVEVDPSARTEVEPSIAEAAAALRGTGPTVHRREPSPPSAPDHDGGPSLPADSLQAGAMELNVDDIRTKTFPVARRGYDRDEVDAFMRSLSEEVRGLVRRVREAEAVAKQLAAAPHPPAGSFEDVGGHVAAVLESATQAAEGIKAEAEDEAAAIVEQAHRDTEHLRRDAAQQLAEVEQLKAQVEEEAARVVGAARSEASALVASARERAREITEAAENGAAALERTVRANVDAIVAEARRDYEHLRTLQQQCVDGLASIEFLAKHARDGLSDSFMKSFDDRLERTG